MITQSRLLEILHYDAASGLWTWRVRIGSVSPGDPAGEISATKRSKPYRRISIDGIRYTASRLAWLYMTGGWPKEEIDHRDRDSLNDRWDNLREASRYVNEANKGAYRNNKCGLKGVSLDRSGRYRAKIQRNWKRVTLGSFDTPEQAAAAYQAADCTK